MEETTQVQESSVSSPEDSPKKNNFLTIGVVVALLVIVGVVAFRNSGKSPSANPNQVPSSETNMEITAPTGETREFVVNGSKFSFDPAEMSVNRGDTVKITYKNMDGTHDFVLDEFSVKTNILELGQEEVVTFIADKSGTFEYYCSVGNHRQMGMVGKLTVQ